MKQGEIGVYIDRTYKVVRQDLINRFKASGIDLTPEQWVIMSKLDQQGEISQTELASMSFKDKPTVSRILDLLVKKGYVNRKANGEDRRKFDINLTERGSEIIALATPLVEESRAVGWTDLSESEYQSLVTILDKIFTNYCSGEFKVC